MIYRDAGTQCSGHGREGDSVLEELEPFCGDGGENGAAVEGHASCAGGIMMDEAFAFDTLLGETVSNGEEALSAVLLVGSWLGGEWGVVWLTAVVRPWVKIGR